MSTTTDPVDWLLRLPGRYVRFVRRHYELERTPVPQGQCHRLHCDDAAEPGSDYCSVTHEDDDAWRRGCREQADRGSFEKMTPSQRRELRERAAQRRV